MVVPTISRYPFIHVGRENDSESKVSFRKQHIDHRRVVTLNACHAHFNRPYCYSRYWTGTSLQLRLMRGISLKRDYDVILTIEKTPHISLSCKLVPVLYREDEYGPLSFQVLCGRISSTRNFKVFSLARSTKNFFTRLKTRDIVLCNADILFI